MSGQLYPIIDSVLLHPYEPSLSNLEAGTPVDGLITSKPYMKACVGAALSLLHQKEKRPKNADRGLHPCEPIAKLNLIKLKTFVGWMPSCGRIWISDSPNVSQNYGVPCSLAENGHCNQPRHPEETERMLFQCPLREPSL